MADWFSPLIGALGAASGGMLTASSIDEQNRLANNQFNANLAFQRYQYEDMKKWQSPSNQVRLMREAGLNPALAMQSNLAGTSLSGVGGVAPTAQHTSGDFSSLPQVAGSLIQALNQNELVEGENAKNFASASKTLQDSIGQSIDNAYKHGNNILAQLLTKYEGYISQNEAAFLMSTFDRRVEEQQFKTALVMSQMEAQSIANKYLHQTKHQEYQLLIAQTLAALASQRLSYEQAQEVVMRKIANFGVDKQDAEDLFDSSMDLIDSQIDANYGSALNSADGDVKSNPFTLPMRGAAAGRISNDHLTRYSRRVARRQYRNQRNNKR